MKKLIKRIFELILIITLIICAVIVGKWYFGMKNEEHVTDEIQNTVESKSNEDYFSREFQQEVFINGNAICIL